MEVDKLDGCSPPPAKLSKMIGEEKSEVVPNGKVKGPPLVNGSSDQTAQVLKDIAILNGDTSEPLEDLCSFTSVQEGEKMEADTNGHSSENSKDGSSPKVKNGENIQNGENGQSCNSVDENSKDSSKEKASEPMDTNESEKKKEDQCDSDSSLSALELNKIQNDVADIDKDGVEVTEIYDKVLDELDSDNDDKSSSKGKKSKSAENISNKNASLTGKKSGDTEESVKETDKTAKKESCQNETSDKEDDEQIKIIDLSDSECPELEAGDAVDSRSSTKARGKGETAAASTEKTLQEIVTNAVKEAISKSSPDSLSRIKISNLTSAAPASKQIKAAPPANKAEDPAWKHSKVNQALSKGPAVEMRPMANALAAIGLDLVREHVYKDLVKLQTKKKSQNKLSKREEDQLDRLKDAHEVVVKKNDTFSGHKIMKCTKCSYCTISKNQFELHKEHAHQSNYGVYECPLCDFETKQRHAIAFHMEAEHNRKCRWLTIPWGFFVCPMCPFEINSFSAYNKHLAKCQKQFKLRRNLEPVPGDCDIPIKPLFKPKPQPKPLLPSTVKKVPVVKPQGKSVSSLLAAGVRMPLSYAQRISVPGNFAQARLQRPVLANHLTRPQGAPQVQPPSGQSQQLVQVQGMWYSLFYLGGQAYLSPVNASGQPHSKQLLAQPVPILAAQQSLAQARPGMQSFQIQNPASRPIAPKQTLVAQTLKDKLCSDVSIQEKVLSCVASSPTDKSFEICEICGGFVKDSDSLRIHFYWAHKIDIPKDVFVTKKPHLMCQRPSKSPGRACSERFWTYQGLQRHRDIVHGETDAPSSKLKIYTCFMCGEANVVSLIGHMRAKHFLAVGSWIRNFKCICCGLIFKSREGLEVHLLSTHGDVFITKGLIDQLAGIATPPVNPSNSKPVPTAMFQNKARTPGPKCKTSPKKARFQYPCASCDMKFGDKKDLEIHAQTHSLRCNRCPQRFNSKVFLEKHYQTHRSDKDECPLCHEKVLIGRPFVRHMKREHMKMCSVVVPKMQKGKLDVYLEKLKKEKADLPAKLDGSVIILDSDDENDEATTSSSKRVSDHSTEDEPKAKRARTETDKSEKDDLETVTVLELSDDGKASSVVEKIEKADKSSPKSDNVEILEVDGETIIVQKEDE